MTLWSVCDLKSKLPLLFVGAWLDGEKSMFGPALSTGNSFQFSAVWLDGKPPKAKTNSSVKKFGASQSWTCAASGSRKRSHETCSKCKSCEFQSWPCSILLHEHEHCTLLCCPLIFSDSGVGKIVSAHLHPKAITGFKISWWQWSIWEAYKVFTHSRHRGCERYLPYCFLCFHNWEEKTNCGSCSQTSRLPPNSCFQETSLYQEHHYLCTGGRKKICTVAEQKSHFQLASLGLSTTGNGTQQNFPQALFSMAHPKPAGKSRGQKFPLASSSSPLESRGHLGEIVKYRREGDTSILGHITWTVSVCIYFSRL